VIFESAERRLKAAKDPIMVTTMIIPSTVDTAIPFESTDISFISVIVVVSKLVGTKNNNIENPMMAVIPIPIMARKMSLASSHFFRYDSPLFFSGAVNVNLRYFACIKHDIERNNIGKVPITTPIHQI